MVTDDAVDKSLIMGMIGHPQRPLKANIPLTEDGFRRFSYALFFPLSAFFFSFFLSV